MFGCFQANALTHKQKKYLRKAESHFLFEEFEKALPYYKKILVEDSTNFEVDYHAGVCYYFSETENRKALHWLENAKKYSSTDTVPDLYYYLALAYQRNNQFQKAIENYQKLKLFIKPSSSEDMSDIDSSIANCKIGIELMQHPKHVRIENMGSDINSSFPDYAPVISADESTLIFTSKRKGTGGKIADDGLYDEDIYMSKKISRNDWVASLRLDSSADKFPQPRGLKRIFFSKAKNIGKAINTDYHDASIAISADGKKLLIYKDNSIWVSNLNNGIWGKPEKLDKNINSKDSYNPSAYFSADEKTLFVVSERKGGYGGKDIYQSTLQTDGSYGPLQNLGPEINTTLDEESPFITADGKTLYFSSQGHNSIGGFDVFKSTFENGKWGKPVNLGYPINSGGNDLFLTLNAAGTRGYYATDRPDSYGGLDIYMIDFQPDKTDSINDLLVAKLKADSLAKTIAMNTAKAQTDSTKNSADWMSRQNAQKNIFSDTNFVYFGFNKSIVKASYNQEIDSIGKYLKANKIAHLHLTGYCDSKGKEAYNKKLSWKRAKSVEHYFTAKGIAKNRITVVGKGSENPVAPNTNPDGSDNPAGRAKNRRVSIQVSEK
ncbi:MAG TPA: OmpA family protein [Bacteroidia bacterium]|nr:OmpA family protein [Bacteroidia bacterium]